VVFLARITWNGQRELVFRVHDPEIADAQLKKRIAEPLLREWSYAMRSDSEWSKAEFVWRLVQSARN
jgi:hypothetical protein